MSDDYTQMSSELRAYVLEHSEGQDELLGRLAEESDREAGDLKVMRTAPDQAALLGLLARAIGAQRALEIGTFTGYGSISIARALSADGKLVTCDVSEQWTEIARRYWDEAGLGDRIELRLGPAIDTLRALPENEPFDFVYIDADKASYPDYYEECVRLTRTGALIGLDNVLYGGDVVGSGNGRGSEESLDAIKRTNDLVVADERVQSVMLGIVDGLTLALKL